MQPVDRSVEATVRAPDVQRDLLEATELAPSPRRSSVAPTSGMMTSNVFGSIAAENLGYSKVVIEQAIAQGDPDCRVVVYLKPLPEAEAAEGREYFKG